MGDGWRRHAVLADAAWPRGDDDGRRHARRARGGDADGDAKPCAPEGHQRRLRDRRPARRGRPAAGRLGQRAGPRRPATAADQPRRDRLLPPHARVGLQRDRDDRVHTPRHAHDLAVQGPRPRRRPAERHPRRCVRVGERPDGGAAHAAVPPRGRRRADSGEGEQHLSRSARRRRALRAGRCAHG